MAKSNKQENELTLTQKLKLAQKGKKLDAFSIELKARKIYGKKYREELAKRLGGSTALFVYAFSNRAPYKLYEIDQHLKSLSN